MAVGITVGINDKALASLINSMAGWGAIGDRPDTGDVIAGSFYYDTTNSILYQEQNGAWVAVLQTQTLNPANEIVEAGYYAATTLSAVDADLAPANIRGGVTIFGKVGTFALTQEGREENHLHDIGNDTWEDIVSVAIAASKTEVLLIGSGFTWVAGYSTSGQGLYNGVQKYLWNTSTQYYLEQGEWNGVGLGIDALAVIQGKCQFVNFSKFAGAIYSMG